MPTFAEIDQLRATPQPAYDQYAAVLAAARAQGRFADPAELPVINAIIARRGRDWCTAVLGFWMPPAGLGAISLTEARMLRAADELGLTPPLPAPVLAARAREEVQDQDRARRRQAERDDRQRRWSQALASCPVKVTVRLNRRRSPRPGPALAHVVPDADAVSWPRAKTPGSRPRRRDHPAGRALCERPDRARPLLLGEPVEIPATCHRCLAYTPLLHPPTTPHPQRAQQPIRSTPQPVPEEDA